jgi:hypothetical protein
MPLLPDRKPDDPILAREWNDLIREKNAPLKIKGGPGINVRADGEGGFQIWLSSDKSKYVFKGKVASGGISARTSDSVHGTGNVEVWSLNPSSGNWEDTGSVQAVTYISSTTGGLSAGVWVNCGWREDGGAEIISVDCGN